MRSASSFAVLAGLSGAMAMPNPVKRDDYACNPAHSYPNGQSCVSTNGGLALVAPTPVASSGYACNPAHSYPNGQTCTDVNGALALITLAPVAAAATIAPASGAITSVYDCNPAHSYPNGQYCTFIDGSTRALVFPAATSTSAAASTPSAYDCNPAHSYPGGAVCTQVNGVLGLVTPSPAATTMPAATATASGLGSWTIENFIRYCAEDGAGCDYNFDIKTSDGFGDHCTISLLDVGPTEDFAGKPCNDGSLYSINWGYAADSNPPFAVITVDQIQDKTRAFFGVPDVNGETGSTYGSRHIDQLGPEPVQANN